MNGGSPSSATTDGHGSPPPSLNRSAGAGSLLTARVFLAVVGWAGTIVIARTLTPSGWGALTFVFGLLGMIGLVADLQVAKLVLRDVMTAGDSAGSVVGTYLLMRLALGIASFAIAIGFVVVSGYEDQILWTTFVGGFEFLLTPPAFALLVWFQSRLWLSPVAAGLVAGGCFQLGTVLAIAFFTDGSPAVFAAAYVVGDVVWLVWELVALRRARLHLRLSVDLRRWGVWLKEAVPLAIGFGLFSVYYKLDLVMLGQLDTLESVGQYSIGYKFADVTTFVPLALLTPVLTLLVSAWPHDSQAAREHFRRAAMLLAVAAVGIGVGFALVAQPLVELLYGSRFAESVDAARLLVIGASIQFFTQLCFVALVALGRNWPYVVAALSGVALNVVLNLVLIPRYSFNGSAVATVITEVVVLVVMFIALRRTPEVMAIPWTVLASTTFAGLIMIVIYLSAVRYVAWPVASGAAALGFLGFLQVVRIDGQRGLQTLWEYLRFEHANPLESPTDAAPSA